MSVEPGVSDGPPAPGRLSDSAWGEGGAVSEARCPACGTAVDEGRYCRSCGLDLTAPARASAALPVLYVEPGSHAPGSILAAHYRVVGRLATGSMGTVYVVEDVRCGERRALKEFHPAGLDAEARAEGEAWFRRESQTLMGLDHPAIPRIHDVFVDADRHCLVMDLVEGRTLDDVLLMHGRPGLPESDVRGWADQLLDVLSYLHSRPEPVVFRDLKPANIMLEPGGRVRLIDFGVARAFTPRTTGTAIGTPGYAAPEQYQGLAEPVSDIYGLGATLHHLLTGRDPRKGRPFEFPPLRSLDPRLSPAMAVAVDGALALDPRARHQSAAVMRQALTLWQAPVPWAPIAAPQAWTHVPGQPYQYPPFTVPPGGWRGGLQPLPPPGALGFPSNSPVPRGGRALAGSAAVCGVVATFVPWYTLSLDSFSGFSVSMNGWHGWGFLAGMAFMAGTVLSAVPSHLAVSQGGASPLADRGQVMLASGGLASVAIAGYMLSEGATLGAGGMYGVSGAVDLGAWVALLCALVMLVGGLMMLHQGRRQGP